MAKTRSQSRCENVAPSKIASNSSQISKEKKKVHKPKKNQMKICRVSLIRLSATALERMIGDIENSSANKPPRSVENDQTRSLRPRAPPKIVEKVPKKALNQIVVLSQAALCTSKAIRIWDNLKKDQKMNEIKVIEQDIVCARMAGRLHWTYGNIYCYLSMIHS